MTYLDWMRGLPAEELALLMLCPNERLCQVHPIHCARETPEHDSCDECIARFLLTDLPEEAEPEPSEGGVT